jgi:hypothetical protein
MLRKTGLASLGITSIFGSTAFATDWIYTAGGSQTNELSGGYGAVANPSNGSFYNDGAGDLSYVVILDSGSSSNLMSNAVQSGFNVPLATGQTYSDIGIGGSETFNVTQPIQSEFAPTTVNNPDSQVGYMNVGQFKDEAYVTDPEFGLVFFDIEGMPVIQNYVMQVIPANLTDFVAQGGVTNIAETHLLTSLPTASLPTHGVYHIPIVLQNFVPSTPVPYPTETTNPVVMGVTATAKGQTTGYTSNWLFDSGASFSIVTPALAALIGINTSAAPDYTVQGLGVGDSIVTFDGYTLASLSIPLSDGNHLVIDGATVFVPETNNLPNDLSGVLGENLLEQATNSFNQNTGEMISPTASPFSEWFLDTPDNQLVLVDPNSAYVASVPEPASLGLLFLGGMGLLSRRNRRRA